jgi:protein tyrosine/serine phosphatase
MSRDLTWDGCLNVRDLGGHSTEDGGETRFGSVVRADSLRQLTGAGWEAAVDYGIRTVVDLRTDSERAEDPPAELPVDVVHVRFFEEDPAFGKEVDEVMQGENDPASRICGTYVLMLERFKPNVAAAMKAVARAPEGGVAVHCMGGKDRTGMLTALLLVLAGVPRDEIGADYALSEQRLRPRHERWLAGAETEEERELVRRIAQTPAEAIVQVLDELERRYGSVEGYLRDARVSEDDLARARSRLRG